MKNIFFGSLVLVFVGCGAPKAGDACDKPGFLCADKTTALECRSLKWTPLPCRGPDGCQVVDKFVKCDMSANQEGDACAAIAEDSGLCASTNDAALVCRQGSLTRLSCKTCTVKESTVVCQP